MNHGGMDHGGGHGSMPMPMPDMCNMNMVWNWDTTNICILTSSWRITTPFSLYLSLALICLAGVLYEWLRLYIRLLDARLARSASSSSSSLLSAPGGGHRRRASLLLPTSNPASASSSSSSGERRASKRRSLSSSIAAGSNHEPLETRKWVKSLETSRRVQMWRSTLYAFSIGVSFLLMLVGMTFNAWIIGAIVAGAGLGHYWFNRDLSSTSAVLAASADDKGLACHM
ncbi:related to CTR2 - Protein involved in copper transport [Ustilago trichophora]|uniref:Copper transport protein n=1 Tax=Ustilago trichophora TaxID=86804 RepID=A0A5C3EAY8_9BASI|nr:related to CTR2 - Protein involved in copper transport [Ustilago trichophora]